MNERDLFAAIGETSEEMLKNSEKKPRVHWKGYLALAACLCLIASFAFQLIQQPPAVPDVEATPQPLPGQKISMEKLDWAWDLDVHEPDDGLGSMIEQPDYWYDTQFGHVMSVEARVVAVLPDVYQIPGYPLDYPKYKILRLEVLETIHGENMPSYIYYLLPEYLSTDLQQFDSLIMTVRQLGCENTMMRNVSRKWMETFDYLFTYTLDTNPFTWFGPQDGSVVAFTDGQLDETLWSLEGWNEDDGVPSLIMPSKYPDFPIKKNLSIAQIKQRIRNQVESVKKEGKYKGRDDVITNDAFDWPEAQAVLEYVKPFENGYFDVSCGAVGERIVYFTRYINGFATDEKICVNLDQKTVTWDNLYSAEDIANATDLGRIVKMAHFVTPPDSGFDGIPFDHCTVLANYEKHGDVVFGLVEMVWGYMDAMEDVPGPWPYTSSKMLVYPDGTVSMYQSTTELQQLIEAYQNK